MEPKRSTKFSSDNQPAHKPGKGPGWRAKILAVLKAQGKTEEDFVQEVVMRALNPNDPQSAKLLDVVIQRLAPINKAVMPTYPIMFPQDATPAQRIDTLIDAVAAETLPADVANMIVSMIKTGLDVQELVELVARMEALEKLIAAKQQGE